MALKVAIVEDEEQAKKNLEDLLKRYQKDQHKDLLLSFFPDAVKFLNDYKPVYDIVFMDIKMPMMNGLDAAKELRKYDANVFLIFVTDLAQYAIKGYEVDAIDFIIKPVIYEHLEQKLDKVIRIIENTTKEPKITIKVDDGFAALRASSIIYVEIVNHRLFYHTEQGVYSAYGSLNEVTKILPSQDFVKCNHCYLVNLKFVTGINKYEVSLGENRLQISHPKKKAFVDSFTDYLGRHS